MKLLSSETAVSEVVGHALILTITVMGISMITLYGVPAIYSLQEMANVKDVEQAFTVLDSRASRVTLGESPLQITSINLGGGTLTVVPNSTSNPSYMVVNSSNFTINISMGKVKYTLGDRTVAYEGGGVWSQYPGGGSVMLSPPEVHFNGWTLTLPVIHIYGNASIGGKGTVAVSFKKNATNATVVWYPSTNTTCCANWTNPVPTNATKVYLNITSDYYLAWAEYARSLGYTKVGVNDTTRTADIELTVVPSTLGENRSITNPIVFRGLNASNPAPLVNFSFRIKPVGNNLDWDIRAKSGDQTLIFFLKDKTSWNPGNKVNLYVGYQDDGPHYDEPAETWSGEEKFTIQPDGYVYVDLLNKSINLTYQNKEVGSQSSSSCAPSGKIGGGSDFSNTGFSWGEILNAGSTQKPLYNITQHYFWKMSQVGDISFNKCPPSGEKAPDASSTMLQNYTTAGALTYLHITENRADVGIS